MRCSSFLIALLLFVVSKTASATQAQPVPVPEDQSQTPQIDIAGVGAATFSTIKNKGSSHSKPGSEINFSDSALFIGAAQRLYDGASIGSTGLGWMTLDQTNEGLGTQLFLNQGFADFQSEHYEVLIGRTDNPTAHLVDFPTIRGDDLITLLNPLNPFSDGKNTEEHRYSNVASFTLNQSLRTFESIHVQHLINSAGIGTDTGVNSFGAAFEYLATPGMEAFSQIPSFGFGYEHFTLDSNTRSGLHQFYMGSTVNLNQSVTNRMELKVQDIVGIGSTLKTFSSVNDTYQANSNAISAALRYLNSPFGGSGYQLALIGAYKNYFQVQEAKTFGAALNGVKRLGQGFDFVAQYSFEKKAAALSTVGPVATSLSQKFEVGFVFSFDSVINQHLSPRRSLLNQRYEYVPN